MSRTNTTTIEGLAVFLVAISVDLVILGTNWADDDLMQWAVVRFHVNDVPKAAMVSHETPICSATNQAMWHSYLPILIDILSCLRKGVKVVQVPTAVRIVPEANKMQRHLVSVQPAALQLLD